MRCIQLSKNIAKPSFVPAAVAGTKASTNCPLKTTCILEAGLSTATNDHAGSTSIVQIAATIGPCGNCRQQVQGGNCKCLKSYKSIYVS